MKTITGYKMGIGGRRNNINVEQVFDYLKQNSDVFIETNRRYNEGPTTFCEIKGIGSIEGVAYTCVYFEGEMGYPSLDIDTNNIQADRKIREIIHRTGWKGN